MDTEERQNNNNEMKYVKVDQYNSYKFINQLVIFNSRKNLTEAIVKDVTKSGNTLIIDHPDLNNTVQVVSRNVYAFVVSTF